MLPNRVVAEFSDLAGTFFFALPEDEITHLKTYTATFKFRLGNDWDSGAIVPFTVLTDSFFYPEYIYVLVK